MMEVTTRLEHLILLFLNAAEGWVSQSAFVFQVGLASALGRRESYAMATIIRSAGKLMEMGAIEKSIAPDSVARGWKPVRYRITDHGRKLLVGIERANQQAVTSGWQVRKSL